jgi:hypothetical protein
MTEIEAIEAKATRLANTERPTRCDNCDRPFAGRMHVAMDPDGAHWFYCDNCLEAMTEGASELGAVSETKSAQPPPPPRFS